MPKTGTEFQIKALQWLIRSINVNHGLGSSAFFARWRHWKTGWALPYPETTGYIIPTLYAYQKVFPSLNPENSADACYHWLLGLPRNEGAFSSLYAHMTQPSLFNTAQILLGLIEGHKRQPSDLSWKVINNAVDWSLAAVQKPELEMQGLYQSGFLAAYYSRAIWPLAKAMQETGREEEWDRLNLVIQLLANKVTSSGRIEDAGFKKADPAYLHTIAYSIRGWWELGVLQDDETKMDYARNSLSYYFTEKKQAGQWAGAYSETPNYRFQCLPGLAQIAIILHKVGVVDENENYIQEARTIVQQLSQFQKKGANPNTQGALAGSRPFWGPYMRLRYPNWSAKFFLDAALLVQ